MLGLYDKVFILVLSKFQCTPTKGMFVIDLHNHECSYNTFFWNRLNFDHLHWLYLDLKTVVATTSFEQLSPGPVLSFYAEHQVGNQNM